MKIFGWWRRRPRYHCLVCKRAHSEVYILLRLDDDLSLCDECLKKCNAAIERHMAYTAVLKAPYSGELGKELTVRLRTEHESRRSNDTSH